MKSNSTIVTYIRGEGVGPEVTKAAIEIIKETGVPIEFVEVPAGEEAFKRYGTPLPDEVFESIQRTKVALKGPLANPIGGGYKSPNHVLRRTLGLYAGIRPIKSFPGLQTPFSNVEITIIMHNMEGPDAGIDRYLGNGDELAEHISVVTKKAVERVLRFAFKYAQGQKRKLTLVHMADQMKCTDGLWLKTAEEVSRDYPDVEFNDFLADNLAQQLVKNPERFGVIVGNHLWGDVFSDLCAGMVGNVGMIPVINRGDGDIALFETAHGTAPKYAGKNVANPTAAILAGKYLLEYVGYVEAATRIERALAQTFAEGAVLTRDLGGTAGTDEFARRVMELL